MIQLFSQNRHGPIGVDIGSRSIKLVQLSHDYSTLVDFARWEWNAAPEADEGARRELLIESLRSAYDGRSFRGRSVIVCLSGKQLFLQNIRVPKQEGAALDRAVQQEIASRIPYPVEEAEIRYWEAADIRLGDSLLREIIVFACHRPTLNDMLKGIVAAGLRPVAVEVEPAALLRSYTAQYRRDDERAQRALLVHIGYSSTIVMIAQNDEALFVKYVDVGGRQMDEAVSKALNMDISEANALRRRDCEETDPEITRSLMEAVRPVAERLFKEVSLCVRYHSVTFRGKALERLLVGGGEASTMIVNWLAERLGMPADTSDPFRRLTNRNDRGRPGQWDIAAGLALRELSTGARP